MQRHGRLRAGFPGLLVQPLTPETAEQLGLPNAAGGIVSDVAPGGPADAAGIRLGDVVLQFGDRHTDDARAMFRELGRYPAGSAMPVRLWRGGAIVDTVMTLGTFPPEFDPVGPPAMLDPGERNTSPGRGMQLAPQADAVEITAVTLNRVAGDLGLGHGDLILRVDERAVRTPDDVAAALDAARHAGRRAAMLLIRSQGRQHWMPARL